MYVEKKEDLAHLHPEKETFWPVQKLTSQKGAYVVLQTRLPSQNALSATKPVGRSASLLLYGEEANAIEGRKNRAKNLLRYTNTVVMGNRTGHEKTSQF